MNGNSKLEFFEIVGDLFDHSVIYRKNPLVLKGKSLGDVGRGLVVVKIHEHKSCGIPQLVGKIAGGLHLSECISCRFRTVAGCKGKSQGVGAVFVDFKKRIDTVSERFGHFSSLSVSDYTVNEHGIKGGLPMCSTPEKIILATQKKIMS